MKDVPHEVPTKTDPEIKVKRQRRRIYQDTPVQAGTKKTTEKKTAVAAKNVTEKKSDVVCNDSKTECTKKTERQYIPVEIRSERIIENAMAASMGLGIIPLPLVDSAGIMRIQLYMIRELSKAYQIKFSLVRSQALVTSLIGGLGSVSIATGLFGSLVKLIPVFGGIAGALTLPVVAGAFTYALGKLCIQSFSHGEQAPVSISQATRRSFNEYFQKGIKAAKGLRNRKSVVSN